LLGWGISPADGNPKGDAIKNAKTPVMDKFESDGPFCELEAHGLAVGLPEGLMGNSEGDIPNNITDNSGSFEYWCWKGSLAGIPPKNIDLISGPCAYRSIH
jgi:hypothetical protein